MIPAGPHPLMMCGDGDPLDEYMKIANSVRFNSVDSPVLERTLGTPTDGTRWTVHTFAKRTAFGATAAIVSAKSGGSSSEIIFNPDGLQYTGLVDAVGASYGLVITPALFRDPAWLPITVNYDSSRAAANRIEMYIGDTLKPFTINTAISTTCLMNVVGATMKIGRRQYDANTNYFNGYLADFYFIDGQALPPSSFGSLHPRTNQWRPKPYAGTYGNNGFHLDFSDGSVADATHLGKDRSGNNNDFTPTNISVAAGVGCDWVEDSPTKNACVLNPLNVFSPASLSNGALDYTSGVAGKFALGTITVSSGEWFWEVRPTVLGGTEGCNIGISRPNTPPTTEMRNAPSGSVYLYHSSGNKSSGGGASTAYGAAMTVNVTVGAKLNLDAGTLEFFRGGVSQGVAYTGLSGEFTLAIGDAADVYSGTSLSLNCGQRAFDHPENQGTAKTLNTKNLKYPKIQKSESAFVARTDTGANIAATLAAARAGFGSYIDIIKRRDASEGWRWIFSDDPGNYLDTSTTNAKAALPAFGGTSYAGYSLKVSASNGVMTGTFVHTNGAASVVNDGQSNARKMVILHRESAGGGAFYCYHPELTAGKLVYLNTATIETTDASINSVTASGFTVDTSLPSGTYRWISIAEIDGGCKLWKYTGTAAADGPFVNCGHQPAILCAKGIDTGASLLNWIVHDTARDTKNVMTVDSYFNTAGSEITSPNFDSVSNGIKGRWNTSADPNVSATRYIGFSLPAFPFRYANAR